MKTEDGPQSLEKLAFIQFQKLMQNRLKHQYCLHQLPLKFPHAPTFCLLQVLPYHRVSMISMQQNTAIHMHRIQVARSFGECSTSHFCLWMSFSGRLLNDCHWYKYLRTARALQLYYVLKRTRWFKYDRDWFVCKQAALRSSCATLREWSHNLHPPSCSG